MWYLNADAGGKQDGVDCGGGCESPCQPYWDRPPDRLPNAPVSGGEVAFGFLLIIGAIAGGRYFQKRIYPFAGPSGEDVKQQIVENAAAPPITSLEIMKSLEDEDSKAYVARHCDFELRAFVSATSAAGVCGARYSLT